MGHSGKTTTARRSANAKALTAFGIQEQQDEAPHKYRTMRTGSGPTIFTIGYEKRDGEELIALLRDAGVEMLVDVREKAMSRRADFRGAALQARCEEAGIEYCNMPDLGSTEQQRKKLRTTGDVDSFMKIFRRTVMRYRLDPLRRLGKMAEQKMLALICYERCHEECHRSIIADIIGDHNDAKVVAIL